MALVPTTDELLDDANALTSYLPQKVALSIRWKANESILFGAGNGIPVGCMNAGVVVTVVKESGQATLSLVDSIGHDGFSGCSPSSQPVTPGTPQNPPRYSSPAPHPSQWRAPQ